MASLSLEGVDVEVVEARHLIADDKGGTSDPFAMVVLVDAEGKEVLKESHRTKTWMKTLSPQWREKFRVGDDTLPSVLAMARLEVRVFDEDQGVVGSSQKLLGSFSFPLKWLAKKNKLRCDAWFPLECNDNAALLKTLQGGPMTGEVRLRCTLVGDVAAVYAELKGEAALLADPVGMKDAREEAGEDIVHAQKFADVDPNELHATVLRARNLPAVDTAMLMGKGSSDPFMKLSCYGPIGKTTVKKKNLSPEWNETFVAFVDDITAVLKCEVFDFDLIGDSDFMCRAEVILKPCWDKLRHVSWYPLTDESGVPLENDAAVELSLWWQHSPERAEQLAMKLVDDVEDEMAEVAFQEQAQADAARKKEERRAEQAAAAEEERKASARAAKRQQYEDEMRLAQEEAMGESAAGDASEALVTISFEAWCEQLLLAELAGNLKKLNVPSEMTAEHFLAQYRSRRPKAEAEEVLELVRAEQRLANKADAAAEDEDYDEGVAAAESSAVAVTEGASEVVRADDEGDDDEEEDEEEEDDMERAARLRVPNELCVALVRARGLPAVDKSSFGSGPGSSDPQATLEVDGFSVKSTPKKSDLNPIWKEIYRLPLPLSVFGGEAFGGVSNEASNPEATEGLIARDDEEATTFHVSIEDVDVIGDNDFMGRSAAVSLKGLGLRWGPPQWLELLDEKGDPESAGQLGAVEVRLRVRHNPAILEPPLQPVPTEVDTMEPEPEGYDELPPNKVCVTLWRGRRFQIMDKSMFTRSGGGSSDPTVRLKVCSAPEATSTTKKKSLDPDWEEHFTFACDAPDGFLDVTLEDYDAMGRNDFMGKVRIPLAKLRHRRSTRRWYALCDANGKRSGVARGDLDLQLRWVHDPALVEPPLPLDDGASLRPPKGERQLHKDKPRNELLITVVRAKNLAPMDTRLRGGGTSDPVITMRVADGGDKASTSVKKKDLNPIYKETFKLSCPQDPDACLEVQCDDWDGRSTKQFMGKFSIKLEALAGGHPHRAWYVFGSQKTGLPDGHTTRGSVELVLRWRHNPDYAEGDPLEEADGDLFPDKPPNELRVGLIRARRLPAMDKGPDGGTSDPVATFKAGGRTFQSPLKKKTLNPRWNWRCCVPLTRPEDGALFADGSEPTSPLSPMSPLSPSEPISPLSPTGAAASGEVTSSGASPPKKKVNKQKEREKAKEAARIAAQAEADAAAGFIRFSGIDRACHLEVVIEDDDAGSKREFMGRCVVPIASLEALKDKKAVRKWFPLAAQASGLKLKPDSKSCGEVELLLKWAYNPALDFSDLEEPYISAHDEYRKCPCNELVLAVLGSTGINVRAPNYFLRSGASDLFVELGAGTASVCSKVKPKELEPSWNERFTLPADQYATSLDVRVFDQVEPKGKPKAAAAAANSTKLLPVDPTAKRVLLGRVSLPLGPLANREAVRGWYDLGEPKTGVLPRGTRPGKAPLGRVEIIARWRHNPALEPPPLVLEPEETPAGLEEVTVMDLRRFGNRLPNEIHVCVLRATSLPAMDAPSRAQKQNGEHKGTTDAFCRISLPHGHRAPKVLGSTCVVPGSVDPVWVERFVHGPLPYSTHHVLRLQCFDRDANGVPTSEVLSSDDLVGTAEIPLVDLVNRLPQRSWWRLSDARGAKIAATAYAAQAETEEGDSRPVSRGGLSDAAASGAAANGDNAVADESSGFTEQLASTPDFGRLEVWLRYAYNPAYDPTYVEAPMLADMATSTSTDLPELNALLEARAAAIGDDVDSDEDDVDGTGVGTQAYVSYESSGGGRSLGVEVARWFFLESPRGLSEDDNGFSSGGGDGLEEDSLGAAGGRFPLDNASASDAAPHGPYNEKGLKELWDSKAVHNWTRLWTEGMPAWMRVNDLPDLKRKLWAYPEPPRGAHHLSVVPEASQHGDDNEALSAQSIAANQRWFFVDEHLGEGPGGGPGKREIVGPESAESLRARFEGDPEAPGSGVGAARVDDGTLAWREGLEEWVKLGAVVGSELGIGRAAGWKPRREQKGMPLNEARFGLGAECCKCGSVATLHSLDALGLDSLQEDNNSSAQAPRPPPPASPNGGTAAAASNALASKSKGGAAGGASSLRPMRSVPPSGRKPVRNSNDIGREVLPDFLWVGTAASSRRRYIKRSPISHVLNVTEVYEISIFLFVIFQCLLRVRRNSLTALFRRI